MKKTFTFGLLVVLVMAMLAPQAMAEGDRQHILRGVIVRVGDHAIVLRVRDRAGEAHNIPIHVHDRTRIGLNGERVRLSDLMPGDRAGVRVLRDRHHDDFRVFATHIRAHRRDG